MSAALDLYAKLTETSDDKERARLIADAFEALEARFPHLHDLATQGHVRESELRLQKEIAKASSCKSGKSRPACRRTSRKSKPACRRTSRPSSCKSEKSRPACRRTSRKSKLQIRESRPSSCKSEEVEARLQQEIKAVELKIGQVEVRVSEVEVNLHKAMAAQTRWLLGGLAVLGAVFKLADLLIVP
jgi:hypothetical protein